MHRQHTDSALILYVPGMDLRNVSAGTAPFISEAFTRCSWATIETQPSPEQLSTVLTGMNPHEHGIWQMKLVEEAGGPRGAEAWFERMPDLLTTTFQCIRHQLYHDCDVPTLPPTRRKAFEMRRLKLRGRAGTADLLSQLGDVPSIASHLGPRQFRYVFTDRLEDCGTIASGVGSGELKLEILQMHALDMMGHWVLDTPAKLEQTYRRIDEVIESFADRCSRRGIALFALTDHGQEPVVSTIDLRRHIRELGLGPAELSYYLQPIMARFWLHTERAREKITAMLESLPHGTLLPFWALEQFDIKFSQPDYGEIYFIADPGYLFFPHDFHHPLVNLFFGLKDAQQRRRLRSPLHVAYHGYLPHHESEKGWIVSLDPRFDFQNEEIKLVDVMPSVLSALGEERPSFMTGRSQIRY